VHVLVYEHQQNIKKPHNIFRGIAYIQMYAHILFSVLVQPGGRGIQLLALHIMDGVNIIYSASSNKIAFRAT
jgi:hypothetical protein